MARHSHYRAGFEFLPATKTKAIGVGKARLRLDKYSRKIQARYAPVLAKRREGLKHGETITA